MGSRSRLGGLGGNARRLRFSPADHTGRRTTPGTEPPRLSFTDPVEGSFGVFCGRYSMCGRANPVGARAEWAMAGAGVSQHRGSVLCRVVAGVRASAAEIARRQSLVVDSKRRSRRSRVVPSFRWMFLAKRSDRQCRKCFSHYAAAGMGGVSISTGARRLFSDAGRHVERRVADFYSKCADPNLLSRRYTALGLDGRR